MCFCAADLPFSLLGDIVTWPYTAAYTFINQPTPVPPLALALAPAANRPQATLPEPATQPMPQPMPLPMKIPLPPPLPQAPVEDRPKAPSQEPTAPPTKLP